MRESRRVNYALYQTGWFACILGAAWDGVLRPGAPAHLALKRYCGLLHCRSMYCNASGSASRKVIHSWSPSITRSSTCLGWT